MLEDDNNIMRLDELKKLGFDITWRTINIGFRGSRVFGGELSTGDILNFSIQKVLEGDDNPIVLELIGEREENSDEISSYIDKLVLQENSDYSIEFRKWRVLYVIKHLPSPDDDFVTGLLDLGDIWVTFEFPIDSPHTFQGRDNNITPEQYYTYENFLEQRRKHEQWICNEIEFLRKQQHS